MWYHVTAMEKAAEVMRIVSIKSKEQSRRKRYRRVAALLRDAGWQVSDGRVERLTLQQP